MENFLLQESKTEQGKYKCYSIKIIVDYSWVILSIAKDLMLHKILPVSKVENDNIFYKKLVHEKKELLHTNLSKSTSMLEIL